MLPLMPCVFPNFRHNYFFFLLSNSFQLSIKYIEPFEFLTFFPLSFSIFGLCCWIFIKINRFRIWIFSFWLSCRSLWCWICRFLNLTSVSDFSLDLQALGFWSGSSSVFCGAVSGKSVCFRIFGLWFWICRVFQRFVFKSVASVSDCFSARQ